jgi:hypothetical protein
MLAVAVQVGIVVGLVALVQGAQGAVEMDRKLTA